MKYLASLIVLVFGCGALWLLLRHRDEVATATQQALRGPEKIRRTITVEPNYAYVYTLEFPVGKVPGRLVGSWRAMGRSANLEGAADDTLIRFRLLGPNNEVVQTLERPTHGSFSVLVSTPGQYTFEFDNRGLIRSSKRLVSLEAEYHFGR
jgi:hypothetical protein